MKMRPPRNKKERTYAALNAEDPFEHNGRVIVWGRNEKGEAIYLGDVSLETLYSSDNDPRDCLDFIRFGR